jgi:spermidine synthase
MVTPDSTYNKRFFFLLTSLVLIAGVVTMSLEFTASRLIIPIFGGSIYTWGSLIGIILAGLALGYHIGGKLADRKEPSLIKFSSIIFSAGLYIVFIPYISPAILSFTDYSFITSATSLNNQGQYAQYAPLFATFALLIIPTLFLGIISPYAVKLATTTLKRLGNTAGNLYSAATIGNIIGTFATVFILIPAFEIRYIIFGLGLTLIILASVIELGRLPKLLAVSVVLVLFLSNTFLVVNPVPYFSGNLVYQKETPYSHLDVVDSLEANKRALYLDGTMHSIMNKSEPNELLIYTRYFPVGFVFNPDAKHVLFVGGGGFSGPRYFLARYPDVTVDVVEIDPTVINVAQKYFNITKNPRLNIYNDDARDFLSKTSNQKYDIIILDAYSKNYVPFHLMTLEFYHLLYNKLSTPNGVIVSNQVGSLNGDTSNLYRAAYKTMSRAFPNVYVFPTDEFFFSQIQNIIVVATKNADVRYGNEDIRQQQYEDQKMMNSKNNSSISIQTADNNTVKYAEHLYDSRKIRIDDVPLLTDQFAPVENLLNPITSKPYNTEHKQIAMNPKVDPYSVEGTMITYVFPSLIAGIWIFYMQSIWTKRRTETEQADLTFNDK